VQVRGPYKLWHHTHEFREVEGGTLMTDRVRYQLPLGFLGSLAHAAFVRHTLNRIFDHRSRTIESLLSPETAGQDDSSCRGVAT
jgi:ligand-binding SRPBCC domain-containing protein